MRPCPYCGKEVQDEAIVCRYCGLDIERPDWLRDKHRCPYCAEWIGRNFTLCPYCKSDLTEEVALFDSELPPLVAVPEPAPEPPLEDEDEPDQDQGGTLEFAAMDELEPPEDEIPVEADEPVAPVSPYYPSDWASAPGGEDPMRAVLLQEPGKPKDAPGVQWLQIDWRRFSRPVIIGTLVIVLLGLGVGGAFAFRGMLPAAPGPTNTPTPTQTPRPTALPTTPSSTQPASALVASPTPRDCVQWDQVGLQDARKTMCVYGVVKRWFAAGDLPFMAIFSEEPGTFALVDRVQAHSDVRPGECIRGEGEIEVMSGTRPFIDITGTVLPCP